MKGLRLEIAEIQTKVDGIRVRLAKELKKLPDNPNITRVGGSAFVITLSSMADVWDPFYHDFKAQYAKLEEIVLRQPVTSVLPLLERLISVRVWMEGKEKFRFHPDVLKNLSKLIEGGDDGTKEEDSIKG